VCAAAPQGADRAVPGEVTKAAHDNEMRWLVVRENMRRFATGAKMYSVFDLARGY
jgi:hypothetical protein